MASTENATRSFYDRISSFYDDIADAGEGAARAKGIELLSVQPGERVLEIGYGTGHSLADLASGVGPDGHVFGVDISEGMHRVATKHLASAGLADRVSLTVAETPPLPYPENDFDAVFLSFTLELFPLDVIPTVLEEIKRVLKPSGRVGVVGMATTLPGENDSLLERTYKWMHQNFPHIVDCQPIAMEQFFADAGLELKVAQRLTIFTMPVAALVGTIPAAGAPPQSTAPVVDTLISDLQQDDPCIRTQARQRLAALGPAAIDQLCNALGDASPQVRWEAGKCLQEIGDPKAAPALVAELADENPSNNWVAAEALIALGEGALVPLLQALASTEPGPSVASYHGAHHVLRGLASLHDSEQMRKLLSAFDKSEPQVAVPTEAGQLLTQLQG